MAKRNNSLKGTTSGFSLRSYFHIHLHHFFASLGRFSRAPFNFLMTVSVIGITLFLPAALLVSINNLSTLSGQVDINNNMSIFLHADVSIEQAKTVAQELEQNKSIIKATLIDKTKALEEFKHFSGFGAAIDALGRNPLPHVIQIEPTAEFSNPEQAKILVRSLNSQPAIKTVQLDLAWLQRFNSLLHIAERAIGLITVLLGFAVLLIISNTIRLELQNRRDEIGITRLFGATQAFIMRPFIYSGFWYGVFGGLLACILVNLSVFILDGPIRSLSALYQSQFDLNYLSLQHSVLWIIFAIFLGVLGAWLVVHRHLKELES